MSAILPSLSPKLFDLRQNIARRWDALAPRERYALGTALLVLGLFIGWLMLVQPAWRSLRSTPPLLDQLDGQLQDMQRLAAESRELRAVAPVSAAQAAEALNSATAQLGESGKLAMRGERAVLTLTNAHSGSLRAWLTEARSAARARPVEMQLQRTPQGYSGTVTVQLPGTP